MEFVSAYIHIPFCKHRCYYCDFNTYAGIDEIIPAYMEALNREIQGIGLRSEGRYGIKSIFFGGGTPSIIPLGEIERILETFNSKFLFDENLEISLEANPGTVSKEYFHGLHELGVNRISLGVQSSSPEFLNLLGRTHSYTEAIDAFSWARMAGFSNISIDMIMNLPNQSQEQWTKDLQICSGLDPEHISIYSLIIEEGTPFQHWIDRGWLNPPDDDIGADLFQYSIDYLQGLGYQHYEISNWARPAHGTTSNQCIHNLQYWKNKPYFGFGAGAHGFIHGVRTINTKAPRRYIQQMHKPITDLIFPRAAVTDEILPISHQEEIKETMMMGLRLIDEGISERDFNQRFGDSILEHYDREVNYLVKAGLLYWKKDGNDKRLCLTQRGILLGNQVFLQFL